MEATDSILATDSIQAIEYYLQCAKHPQFSRCEHRLKSFESWPKYHSPSKDDLAVAGFVYTGRSDIVYCFCCGIRLKDWEPKDIAWIEHIKHSPSCVYVDMIVSKQVNKEPKFSNFYKKKKCYCGNENCGSFVNRRFTL